VPPVEVNGVRLLVEESGGGDPLVLVHGSWDDRQVWALIEEDLARRFRVISYDRRGHTGSQDSHEPGTRRDDEDDLADLIGSLELARRAWSATPLGPRLHSVWRLVGPSSSAPSARTSRR
jgi:pimeloyl-ACP methyl ester carboxylesterase